MRDKLQLSTLRACVLYYCCSLRVRQWAADLADRIGGRRWVGADADEDVGSARGLLVHVRTTVRRRHALAHLLFLPWGKHLEQYDPPHQQVAQQASRACTQVVSPEALGGGYTARALELDQVKQFQERYFTTVPCREHPPPSQRHSSHSYC